MVNRNYSVKSERSLSLNNKATKGDISLDNGVSSCPSSGDLDGSNNTLTSASDVTYKAQDREMDGTIRSGAKATCKTGTPTGLARPGRFQYFADRPHDLTDSLRGYNKYRNQYMGTHPDSLYRVSDLSHVRPSTRHAGPPRGLWGCWARRDILTAWRVLRWPLALIGLCIVLGLAVYFLVVDNDAAALENEMTSSDGAAWTTPPDPDAVSRHDGVIKYHEDLYSSTKNPPLDHIDQNHTKNIETDLIEFVTATDEGRSSEVLLQSSSGEDEDKFEEESPSGEEITTVRDTEIDTNPSTQFAIFYKENTFKTYIEDVTKKSEAGDYVEREPVFRGISVETSPNIEFTSGHQNNFGVPIEEDERLRRPTTPASLYRTRVSPTLPSVTPRGRTTTVRGPSNYSDDGLCYSTRLNMCRGVLPYDLTTAPLVPELATDRDLSAALRYFQYILQSGCSLRAPQFLCSVLEPECRPHSMGILSPCRKVCKAVLETCSDTIAASSDLSRVFDCAQYPDSTDPEVCVNLARGHCLPNEFRCADRTCIPIHWRCDRVLDCTGGDDEANCTTCNVNEFRCTTNNACIPLNWRCDNHLDCTDGSDEANCPRVHRTRPLEPHVMEIPAVAESAHVVRIPAVTESDRVVRISTIRPAVDRRAPVALPFTMVPYRTSGRAQPVPLKLGEDASKEIMMTSDLEPISSKSSSDSSSHMTSSHTSPCPAGELRCVDGRCIGVQQLCDHVVDCTDGADEANCFSQ